jgi:hypothetical protein
MSSIATEWTKAEIAYLSSLPDSMQLRFIESLTPQERKSLTEAMAPRLDERAAQAERMAKKRAAARDIYIPEPADIARRELCLADPERFLRTYFASTFSQPFTSDRLEMLASIIDAAKYGGDKAVAGPRGEGKTRIAMYGALYLMVAGLSSFVIVIGKSQGKAQVELKTIRERLQTSKVFIEDFPEIGVPFAAVGGWSSRCRMQTVNGRLTGIEMAADHLIFPTIEGTLARGQIIASLGVDGPIRGTNYYDRRPTLAIIDDIEDRESASSKVLIEKNQEIIEQDIGGLGESGKRVSRVMLCTVQNRQCIAYKYTSDEKPWNGKRYRKLITPPSRTDLIEQYIDLRNNRSASDPQAREAFRFWKDNQAEIERDAIVSNPYSYDSRQHSDGDPMELSALQAYYNRVADVGAKAVATEDDNDPPPEAGPVDNGLTAEIVQSRRSGLEKYQLPANTTALTVGIDLGQYYCHWCVVAWWHGAGGCVVDYGFISVLGAEKNQGQSASELLIYQALLNWRDELLNKNYTDATGVVRKVDRVFVDSGDFTNAAYEFCRQVRGPFFPSKGQSPFHPKTKSTETIRAGSNVYAAFQPSENLWLHHLDADYWKAFVHERFLTPTFDENNMLRRGSLSLYHTEKSHGMYSQHIVAEQYMTEFKEGKGERRYWHKLGRDNHWLDATYMAAAASEAMGIRLLKPSEVEVVARPKTEAPKPQQHGRFRSRPGGWVNSIRRNR